MQHHTLGARFDVRESWALYSGDRNLQPGDMAEVEVSRIGRRMHRRRRGSARDPPWVTMRPSPPKKEALAKVAHHLP